MKIDRLQYEDFEQASRLLWKSFYHAEKNRYSMAGMERFRDLTEPVSLSVNSFDGSLVLFGAWKDDILVGVGGVKEKKHILLLYVLPEESGKGVGSALLSFMENFCESDTITLNSSDGAVSFYSKRGFQKKEERSVVDEMIFTPMAKEKSSAFYSKDD